MRSDQDSLRTVVCAGLQHNHPGESRLHLWPLMATVWSGKIRASQSRFVASTGLASM